MRRALQVKAGVWPSRVGAMKRDYSEFPEDDNGAILWKLREHGDLLTAPREIDFTVILPSEKAALDFAIPCLQSGFKVELNRVDPPLKDGLNWEVLVYTTAVPSYPDITALEAALNAQAAPLGGRASGWSTLFVPPAKR